MAYKSYKKQVKERMREAGLIALEAVGLEAQRDVSIKITDNGQVDTGRMRASITYITGDRVGDIRPDKNGVTHNEDRPRGKLKDNVLHIGTNVNYAIWQEKKIPFLEVTIIKNMVKYQNMISQIYAKIMNRG